MAEDIYDEFRPGDQYPPTPPTIDYPGGDTPTEGPKQAWPENSGVPKDWLEDFLRRNPGDEARAKSAYESNNTSRTNIPGLNDEQTKVYKQFQQQFTNVPSQFDDPITSWLEQFAQTRAQQRENPPSGSGQNLLEEALRNISQQLQGGGFTTGEQELYTTQAMDPLEKLRQARRQQVMQELQRRGIAPNSGVAIQMLQDVDRQFDQSRTQTQAGLSQKFADERMNRLMQSINLLGGLAGTENQRLNEAFQYRQVPMNLADRAWNQSFQLYNSANPLAGMQPLFQLAGMQQGRGDNLQEILGYLAAILANQ